MQTKVKIVLEAETGRTVAVINGVAHEIENIDDAAKVAQGSLNNLKTAAVRLGGALGSLFAADKLKDFLIGSISITDEYRGMTAQLRSVTDSMNELGRAQEAVYQIAQSTGAELGAVTTTFTRITRSIADMGGGIEHSTVIVQALNDALKINRASTEEAASAQLQFSQAIASGVLRGEEFNAISEAAPPLLDALAKQLNVTRGELREMAFDGQLTSEVVLPAIIAASEELRKESEAMGISIPAAWTKVVNAFQKYLGQSERAVGVTETISGALSRLSENISTVADGLLVSAEIGMLLYLQRMAAIRNSIAAANAALLQFTVRLTGSMGAVKAMTLAMNALGKAVKAALVVFTAYEIGKYLWDEFATVRKAMRVTVTALSNGWERMKYGAKVAAAGIRFAFQAAFDKIRQFYAVMLQTIARGFDMIGADETAASIQSVVDKIHAQGTATDQLRRITTEAYEEMTRSIELNNAELEEALLADQAEFEAKKNLGSQTKKTAQDLEKLASTFTTATRATKEDTKATKENAKAAKEAQQEKARLIRSFLQLEERLYPAIRAERKFHDEVRLVNEALLEGIVTEDEAAAMIAKLGKSMDKTKGAAKEMREEASPMAKAWESAMERIDSAFADAWKGAFDSFKDFTRRISDALRQWLAEMAHQLITRPLVVGITTAFMPGGAAMAGTGGMAVGGFGIPGFDMAGMVSTGLGYAATYGGSLLAGAGGQQAAMLAAQASEFGLAGASMTTSALGGVGAAGASLGALALSGGLGYLAGSQLGGNGGIGGAAGAAAGMAIGGPVGAVVGGVGGALIGGLTGGEWEERQRYLDLSWGDGGISGEIISKQKKNRWMNDKWREVSEQIDAELKSAIDAKMNATLDTIKAFASAVGQEMDDWIDQFQTDVRIDIKGKDPDEILAEIQAWVDKVGTDMMKAVLPAMTDVIEAAGTRAGELIQPLAQLASYMNETWEPQIRQSFSELSRKSYENVMDQIRSYDRTLEDTKRLAGVVTERYQLEVQLLQAIGSAQQAIDQMIGRQKEDIWRATHSAQELLDRLRDDTAQALEKLKTAATPEEVKELVARITSNVGEAMRMAGEDQIQEVGTQMNAILDRANAIAEARLEEMEQQVKKEHESVADAVREIMLRGADGQKAAADALARAAARQTVAAINLDNAAANINSGIASIVRSVNRAMSYYAP